MDRVHEILALLSEHYPNPKPSLNFETPFQLLVATMLSAQCTDKRVNMVTESLFQDYPDARTLAALTPEELEPRIRTCGLSKTKAARLVETSRILIERYQGQVPDTLEELVALPGVGRKTADVVLANAFKIPAFAVDTHVYRVSHRLQLARAKSVEGTERDLMATVPREQWIDAHHWLIFHGRAICKPKPQCMRCFLAPLCPRDFSLTQ